MCRRSSWRIVIVVIDVDVVLSNMTTTSTLTTVKVTRSVLEDQLENCKQLLDLEPDSKWPLLTQVILADQGDPCSLKCSPRMSA